jgi:hypothetical protein
MSEVKAKGIFQSVSFDGSTVHYRRMLRTASIPLASVASVEHSPTGSALTVVDSGGTRYRVAVWSGGRKVRDAIETAKRGSGVQQ